MRGVEVVFHQGALAVGAALGAGPADDRAPSTSRARSTSCSPRATRACGASSSRRRRRSTATRATLPRVETQFPDPISPYAVAKLAAERYCCQLRARLRARDGRAPLLQRLRPAPGPDLAVRGRRAALHRRGRRAASRSRSTATASSRATSRTSTTSSTRTCARPTRPRRTGHVFNVATGEPRERQRARRRDRRGPRQAASRRSTCPPRTGDVRDSWADVAEARRAARLGAVASGSRTGCA